MQKMWQIHNYMKVVAIPYQRFFLSYVKFLAKKYDFNRKYSLKKRNKISKIKYNDLLRYLTATGSNELNGQVNRNKISKIMFNNHLKYLTATGSNEQLLDPTLQFRHENQLNEIFA